MNASYGNIVKYSLPNRDDDDDNDVDDDDDDVDDDDDDDYNWALNQLQYKFENLFHKQCQQNSNHSSIPMNLTFHSLLKKQTNQSKTSTTWKTTSTSIRTET